jgi:hypothetical protein
MNFNNYNLPFSKLQALFRLWLLQQLIPPDGRFELSLSLALDRVLIDLEAEI